MADQSTTGNISGQEQGSNKKGGFDFKFFIMALVACGLIMMLINIPLIGLGIFYLTKQGLGARYGGTQKGCGDFANVPEPYAQIFSAAGNKFVVQPAFVAAIFYGGEHQNSWPDSAGPWASSPKGAQGPFQFMPGTWAGHQQDGDNDGVKDVQNLWDSAFGAAHLFSQIGAAGNTTNSSDLIDAAARYNSGRPWSKAFKFKETRKYVPRVMAAFNKFYKAGGGVNCSGSTPGGAGSGTIVSIARGELGVKEPEAWHKYGPDPWCARFVSWVYTKAGYKMNQPSVSGMKSYFENYRTLIPPTGNPAPGDVISFVQWSHVGIVESVNGNTISYINGNTGGGDVDTGTIDKNGVKWFGRW